MLMAYRYQARKTEAAFAFTSVKYSRVLAVVIESGMIYSSVLVIEIVLYVMGDNAFYIVYDPIAQLTVSIQTSHSQYFLATPCFDHNLFRSREQMLSSLLDREWYRL